MTKKDLRFFINIDKIILNFDNQNANYTDNELFRFEFVKPYNGYYHSTILVYYKNIPFGTISHKNIKNANNSQFRVNNRQLYVKGFSLIIIDLFKYLNIKEFSLATFENSINCKFRLY
ncbi:hypothetical protein GCM10011518_44010 [Flavobacterium limi]|uniref:Uncharacterized protein n=1 Tax=Flavobacterium limi TaxID=2045105 RepID=A0ABQ1UZ78_9FLAO|nr:hypothetical protein GCM10011518_44010 [Flavobacterium limi]